MITRSRRFATRLGREAKLLIEQRRCLSSLNDKDLIAPSSKSGQSNRFGRAAENIRKSKRYRNEREPVKLLPNLVLDQTPEEIPEESYRWRVGEKEPPLPLSELMTDPVVPVYSIFEKTQEDVSLELPWRIFREPLRLDLMHDYVIWQRTNRRQISRAAKTRGEKRGSTRKIYKQKGTGRARMGPNRSAIRKGSGKAFGPKRREFTQKFNKQQRRMALRVVVSQKLRENRLFIVHDMFADSISTRTLYKAVNKFGWTDAVFIHDDGSDLNNEFFLSIRNLPTVDLRAQKFATVYTILKREYLVLTRNAALTLAQRIAPAPLRTWRSIDDLYNHHQLPPLLADQARAQFSSSITEIDDGPIHPFPLPPPAQ